MSYQANEKVTLPSGRQLEFQMPSLAISNRLKCLVFRLAKDTNVAGVNLESLKKGTDLAPLVAVFCALLGSEELDAMLLTCMKQGSLLEGQKITEQTFEAADFRRDYIPCQKEVGWRTLSPFFQDAGSLLSGLGSLTTTPNPT